MGTHVLKGSLTYTEVDGLQKPYVGMYVGGEDINRLIHYFPFPHMSPHLFFSLSAFLLFFLTLTCYSPIPFEPSSPCSVVRKGCLLTVSMLW